MGIYIEDMKMPQQGEFKHVRIYDNGEVTVQVDTGKEVYEAVIAHAVQISPHGRLIDADVVVKKLREGYFNHDMQMAREDPCIVDAMIDWAIRQVKDAIEDEAEDGE